MIEKQSTLGDRTTNRRVFIGSLSGSAIEWFGFFLHATAAAIIFDRYFFPTEDPLVPVDRACRDH